MEYHYTLVSLLLIIVLIKQILCQQQYIYSDKAEFNSVQIIDIHVNPMTSFGDSSQDYTITFQKRFIFKPQLIMGLSYLDYGANDYDISFEYAIKSIDPKNAVITVTKYNSTRIWGTQMTFLAIQDSRVIVQTFKLLISNGLSQTQSFQLQGTGSNKQSQCFLIGINSKNSPNSQRQYGIYVNGITTTQYTINIDTTEEQYLSYVVVNCIEYFQEPIGAYTMIADSQTLQSTGSILASSPESVSATINPNFVGSIPNSFIGISVMKNQQISSIDAVRVSVQKQSYASNKESIQLSSWANSQIYQLQIGYFHFQMYNCKANDALNKINLSDQNKCVETCPEKYYKFQFYTTDVCRNCQESCLTCDNDNDCLSCDTNSYLDGSSLCKNCDANCLTCKTNATNCKSCAVNSILYNNKCYSQQSCDTNQYCQYCFNGQCITCKNSDNSTCSSPCQSGYYNLNSTCQSVQPNNTYCDSFNICKQCTNTNCKQCSSSTLSECSSCNNIYLYNGNCQSTKPTQTYCDGSKICLTCTNTACLFCDNLLNNCIQCPSGKYLYNKECYDVQQAGTFCSATGNYQNCQICTQSGCQYCNTNINQCSSCSSSQYLYNNQCYDQQPTGTKCNSTGTFSSCSQCTQSGCQTCNNDANQCSSCLNGQYLYNNTCMNTKPTGVQCNLTNGFLTCQACTTQNCQSCNSYLSKCSSCISNTYLYNSQCTNLQPEETQCTFDSNLGFFNCQKCQISGCQFCNQDLNKCQNCINSWYMNNQQCSNTQPAGTQCKQTGNFNSCEQCQIAGCQSCNDDKTKCSTCSNGQYLYNSQCQDQQPTGTKCISNNGFYSCENCTQAGCKYCNNDLNQCSVCSSNQYLFNFQCYDAQPNGSKCTLLQGIYTCEACATTNCEFCNSDINKCSSCQNSYKYFFKDQCYNTQPNNTYCDSSNICTDCSASTLCQVCDSTKSKCVKCQSTEFFYNDSCLLSQPNGTTCHQNICITCSNTKCKTCNSDKTSCINCLLGDYYSTELQDCFKQPPPNNYCSQDNICQNCTNKSCQVCDITRQNCTECPLGKSYLFQGDCFYTPPFASYCDQSTKICEPCSNKKCQTCSSDLSTCETCLTTEYLYNGNCTSKQVENTYCNDKKICTQCKNSNCLTCNSNLAECLSCPSLQYFYENNCKKEKPINTFCEENNQQFDCYTIRNLGCHESCGSCFGNNNNQCVSCDSSTRSYDPLYRTCKCNQGYNEVEMNDCEEITPLFSIFQSSSQVQTYIIISLSTIFLFSANLPSINYTVQIIQIISLTPSITSANQNLAINQFLHSLQKLNILTLFQFYETEQQNKLSICIIGFILFMIPLALGLISKISHKQYSLKLLFRWNLTLLISRYISLYAIFIIVQTVFNYQQNTTNDLILGVMLLLPYSIFIALLIKGSLFQINQINQTDTSNDDSNLSFSQTDYMQRYKLRNQLAELSSQMYQPQVAYTAVNQCIRGNSKSSQFFWLIIEIRKLIAAISICLFDKMPYIFFSMIAFSIFQITLILIKRPFIQKKENFLLIGVEILSLASLTMIWFQLNNKSINSQLFKQFSNISMALISAIQVIAILFFLVKVYQLIQNKLSSHSIKKQNLISFPKNPQKSKIATIEISDHFKQKTNALSLDDIKKTQFQIRPTKSSTRFFKHELSNQF